MAVDQLPLWSLQRNPLGALGASVVCLRGEEVGVSVLQFLLSYLWVQLCGV